MLEFEAAQECAKLEHNVWQETYKRARKDNQPVPEKPKANLEAPLPKHLLATDVTFEKAQLLLAENPFPKQTVQLRAHHFDVAGIFGEELLHLRGELCSNSRMFVVSSK